MINELKIPTNSKLKIIGKNAFYYTSIKNIIFPSNTDFYYVGEFAFNSPFLSQIEIPSSVVELKQGWLGKGVNLTKIKIIENEHQNLKYFDNKFIIGKSDINKDVFDILYFARRNITNVVIPSFIKEIAPYAFAFCYHLKNVEVQENSDLKIIGHHAFSESRIENISIPIHLTHICNDAFSSCNNLKFIKINENSDLQIIDEYAFNSSSIECFSITPNIKYIGYFAFENCYNLKIIEINENFDFDYFNRNCVRFLHNTILMIPVKSK